MNDIPHNLPFMFVFCLCDSCQRYQRRYPDGNRKADASDSSRSFCQCLVWYVPIAAAAAVVVDGEDRISLLSPYFSVRLCNIFRHDSTDSGGADGASNSTARRKPALGVRFLWALGFDEADIYFLQLTFSWCRSQHNPRRIVILDQLKEADSQQQWSCWCNA